MLLYDQLLRANDPHQLALFALPFDIPASCEPNRWNMRKVYVQECCSWECWNNCAGDVFGGDARRLGERDALYGYERVGLGWR